MEHGVVNTNQTVKHISSPTQGPHLKQQDSTDKCAR